MIVILIVINISLKENGIRDVEENVSPDVDATIIDTVDGLTDAIIEPDVIDIKDADVTEWENADSLKDADVIVDLDSDADIPKNVTWDVEELENVLISLVKENVSSEENALMFANLRDIASKEDIVKTIAVDLRDVDHLLDVRDPLITVYLEDNTENYY